MALWPPATRQMVTNDFFSRPAEGRSLHAWLESGTETTCRNCSIILTDTYYYYYENFPQDSDLNGASDGAMNRRDKVVIRFHTLLARWIITCDRLKRGCSSSWAVRSQHFCKAVSCEFKGAVIHRSQCQRMVLYQWTGNGEIPASSLTIISDNKWYTWSNITCQTAS